MKLFAVYDHQNDIELEIYMGENAKDNWDIIDMSSQNDIWFHLESHPSPHVMLKLPNNIKNISKQTIMFCAAICKQNSKLANSSKISVIYTERKNITKGKNVGSVFTKKVNSVTI
ncbi:protein of unknown function DUF814 [Catovirus CTV1]|uniref:NFACT RNA-binding domain-containing protein n=1 Tax=Catovirus CTV1 TaxID=1977631 RepID=A0A1V0SBW0_9VIRU|nr:protein of unknown function DUF814 [Catovirus CTV1]